MAEKTCPFAGKFALTGSFGAEVSAGEAIDPSLTLSAESQKASETSLKSGANAATITAVQDMKLTGASSGSKFGAIP